MDLSHCRAVIVIAAMRGCPACEEYKPRVEREVARWQASGAPLVFGDKGQRFAHNQVPILFLDAQSRDPDIQRLMDDFKVEGLPTTILFMRTRGPQKMEGALEDGQIYNLLMIATTG